MGSNPYLAVYDAIAAEAGQPTSAQRNGGMSPGGGSGNGGGSNGYDGGTKLEGVAKVGGKRGKLAGLDSDYARAEKQARRASERSINHAQYRAEMQSPQGIANNEKTRGKYERYYQALAEKEYKATDATFKEKSEALDKVLAETGDSADYGARLKAAQTELADAKAKAEEARDVYQAFGGKIDRTNDERFGLAVKSGAEGSWSSILGSVGTLHEAGTRTSKAQLERDIADLQTQLEQAQQNYKDSYARYGSNDDPNVRAARQRMEEIASNIDLWQGMLDNQSLENTSESIYGAANKAAEQSALDLYRSKEGLGTFGRGLMDVTSSGTQMLGDIAAGYLLPGGMMTAVGLRSFGGGALEARNDGASFGEQLGYGAAQAGLEMLTEKISDAAGLLKGGGSVDDVVKEVVRKWGKTDAGRTALLVLFGGIGEAAEEGISGLLSPALKTIYEDDNKTLEQTYGTKEGRSQLIKNTAHDALIGGLLGNLSTATGIFTGHNAAELAEMRKADANLGSINSQVNNMWDVLSGKTTAEEANARAAEALARSGGQTALDTYATDRARGVYDNMTENTPVTPEQQSARTSVANALASGKVNNTTAEMILKDPELRAAAEWQTGLSFEGMTVNEARTALQKAARDGAYKSKQFGEITARAEGEAAARQAEAEATAAAEKAQADAAEAARLEEEAVRNNDRSYDSYVRGLLRSGVDGQTAREILNNPAMREAWERLTGKTLPQNEKSALKMLQQTTRQNVDIDVDNAIQRYIDEQTAPAVEDETTPAEIENAPEAARSPVEATEASGGIPTPPNAQTASTASTDASGAALEQNTPETVAQEPQEQLPPVNENGTPKEVQSQSHSLEGQANAYGVEYEAPTHISKPEVESLNNAINRADADMTGEMHGLMGKEAWTGEDLDTAMVINGKLLVDAIKNNDFAAVDAWSKVVETRKSEAGRALQALSKWARGGRAVVNETQKTLDENKGISPAEKSAVMNKVLDYANRFDLIENGDIDSLRKLILDMNAERGTGTFIKSLYEKFLNGETDFDYLKEYAMRQLMAIPNDTLAKPDLGKRLKTWQSLAQLMRITTTLRNVLGNETFGILDFVPQNTVGTWLDALISAIDGTGVRTVGMSSSWLDSDARKAMGKAIDRSMMEIAGDVYMGGQNAYGTNGVRTFKANDGNVLNRVLSRAEQLSGYALQTTDEAASARQTTAYINMLNRLNGENLTDAQKEELAKQIAEYRLFKNNGLAKDLSQGAHDWLNRLGVGGEIKGKHREGGFGAAELLGLSYPGVPANLGVKPLEFSPANVAKGLFEIFKYFSDAKKNGSYDYAMRQNAVMDMARGVTGTALIAALTGLFKSGIFKFYDDEDDYDVQQQNRAEGKNGTLINMSAFGRLVNGGDAEWQPEDRFMNIGYLQPANSLLAITHLISKDAEDGLTAAEFWKDFGKGSWNGLLDMPVMQSISSLADVLATKYDEETGGSKLVDSLVTIGGNAVTGMIPGFLSQTAKAMDTVDRDTSGDTALERTLNAAKKTIPGLRETLPEKYDSLGNVVKLDENPYDRIMNALVRPGTIGTLKESEASRIISDVIEQTGDKSVMPDSRAPATITIDGEKVSPTASEKRAFKKTYGGLVSSLIDEANENDAFKNASPEQQGEIIAAIEKYAKDRAKAELAEKRGGTYESAFQTLLDGTYEADGDVARPPLEEKNLPEYFTFSTLANSAYKAGDYDSFQGELANFDSLDDNTKQVLAAQNNDVGYYARLLMGQQKSGENNDVEPLDPGNVAEYAKYDNDYKAAESARDYAALDKIVSDFANLDGNTQTVMAFKAKGNTQLNHLLEMAGLDTPVSAEDYYRWYDQRDKARDATDSEGTTNSHVKALSIAASGLPEEEKVALLNSEAVGASKTLKALYEVMHPYGFDFDDVAKFWYGADYSYDKQTEKMDADGTLKYYEAAAMLQRTPGLTDTQRSHIFSQLKEACSNNNNNWYNKTYSSALRNSGNYVNGRTDEEIEAVMEKLGLGAPSPPQENYSGLYGYAG